MQTIQIQTSHNLIFIRRSRFFLYDGGQDGDFRRCQINRFCLLQTCFRPEGFIFTIHTLHQFFCGNIPIDLIGVRNKHGEDCFGSKSQRIAISRIVQQDKQVIFIQHQLFVQPFHQIIFKADIIKGKTSCHLMTAPQIVQQFQVAHSRRYRISAGLHISLVLQESGQLFKTSDTIAAGRINQLTAKFAEILVFSYIQINRFFGSKVRRPCQTVSPETCARQQKD